MAFLIIICMEAALSLPLFVSVYIW